MTRSALPLLWYTLFAFPIAAQMPAPAGISTEHFGSRAMPIPIAGTLADAHSVAIVFHDKSRVTEAVVREGGR